MQGGPPVPDSPASQESAYCHALVHRKEGEHDGELGLTGWDNSCFWFRTAGRHGLYPAVQARAREILVRYGGDLDGGGGRRLGERGAWDPDEFTTLCQKALAAEDAGEKDGGGGRLEQFCNEVAGAEWKLLLDTCVKGANEA